MASKLHRYEAAVKLSNERVVVYHNINTGLFKFHNFLNEKFDGAERWLYYSVRRKENKEIIGKYRNSIQDKEKVVVNIFGKFSAHKDGKGIYMQVPIKRGDYEIVRNKFISNKNILHSNSLMITIPEWLFERILEEARQELFSYYKGKGYDLILDDLSLGTITFTKEKIIEKGREEEKPEQNFP